MKNLRRRCVRWSISVFGAVLLASILLLTQSSAALASVAVPEISAKYASLVDLTTMEQLMEKEPDTITEIASATKIMTALLVLESGKLHRSVTIKQEYVDYIIENGASSAGLQVGDTLSVKQLLYALMLPSGCDAAFALADVIGGDFQHFVQKMNHKAQKLGLTNTYYTTPDGLHNPDSQGNYGYSTATDLLKLTAHAMRNPLFLQMVGTATYTVGVKPTNHAYTWTNTNRLLNSYEGVIGVKTGTTAQAGYVLVFAAVREGRTLLGVILSSASNDLRYQDATVLLDWGFSQASYSYQSSKLIAA